MKKARYIEMRSRLKACREQIAESPYSHTVAAAWYAEDVQELIYEISRLTAEAYEQAPDEHGLEEA